MRFLLIVALVWLEIAGGVGSVRAQQAGVASSPPAASEADIAALRERAAAYWAARVAGDAEKQWQLLEPRGRGRISAQEYGASPTGGKYLAYQVEEATVKGYFATVKVRLLIQQVLQSPGPAPTLAPQTTIVEDGWIRIGGVWYRRFEDGGKAPAQARE
jgi:hypothetical protein